jgi:hypothetical protein
MVTPKLSFADLYREERTFDDVRGKFKGQPGFVAASVPTLRHFKEDEIKGKPLICVNNSILKFPSAPYYFTCDWSVIWRLHWQTVRWLTCKVVTAILGVHELDRWSGLDNPRDRLMLWHYAEEGRSLTHMSDQVHRLVLGTSSVHSAVHFAHILGCDPIILLGNDCGYEDGKKYYTDFEGQPPDRWLLHKWEPEVVEKEDSDGPLIGSAGYWDAVRERNPHIQILNGTGGALSAFPRVNWRDYV